METNKINELFKYDDLTKVQQEKIKNAFEECATIFAAAVLRIEKVIDVLSKELYEEENKYV